MKLKGIGASSGISIAKVYKYSEAKIEIKKSIGNPEEEKSKFKLAIANVTKDIKLLKTNISRKMDPEELAIFDAHIQIASDPMMIEEIENKIEIENVNAIYATDVVTKRLINTFENMNDSYMKERSADIRDVSRRLINSMSGIKSFDIASISKETIIVANDLTPSDTVQLNKKFIKGFVTNTGGKTSHAAIMARSLEIPAILGATNITSKVTNEDTIAINGNSGEIIINPTNEEINSLLKKSKELKKELIEESKFKGKESLTKDGNKIKIAGNIGNHSDVENVIINDGDAVGLFRSEFLYMDAKDWPSEDEQFNSYKSVLSKMKDKQVVVRTLDIGGDKTLDYFEFPKEMNPFLGYRAIRFCLDKKSVFKTQLRALIRASKFGNLAIMFPMIATIDEFKEAKKVFERCYKDLISEGAKVANREDIEVGMMVEIPSVAILANQFAKYSDFFSIGTNDLMQYTMAADRMSEKVSYLYQPLNPSILSLINMTIKGAHKQGKWVGMCGEMAGDKNAVPLLVGMGLDEFSMSASSILKVRKQISEIDSAEAKILVEKALESDTQDDVKKLVNNFNEK